MPAEPTVAVLGAGGTMGFAREFAPFFQLKLAAKDARLAEESARARALDLPVLGAIRERLQRGSSTPAVTGRCSALSPAEAT